MQFISCPGNAAARGDTARNGDRVSLNVADARRQDDGEPAAKRAFI